MNNILFNRLDINKKEYIYIYIYVNIDVYPFVSSSVDFYHLNKL